MARIRTIKPEFWEDEGVAALSRDARLLWIATWNCADDEGILRWTPDYIKAQVFPYDADVTLAKGLGRGQSPVPASSDIPPERCAR